ncbi:type II secretion system F family protein [Falsiroseomonas oryzae]|uniref:type II secretion system F family protein n=1 Tax=Falsiroseomonas oryzae TaxID=2766473 RepID=UPI0022EBA091|nr:type II secretion system F family protein [Roseomonas sp. MO-31]
MAEVLLVGSLVSLLAALILMRTGQEQKSLRDRVLAQDGRTVSIRLVDEPSLIARPASRGGPLTRISGWLGLAPGLLPNRRLPLPFVLLMAGVTGGVAAWGGTLVLQGPAAILLGLAAAAFVLRMLFMWEVGRNRDEAFKQIPDAVGLMVRAVRAGLPVGEAVRSVAREMPEPTRSEFQRLIGETGIGTPLDRALWGIHERTGLREYAFLSVVIGLQAQTGGGLAEALENIGDIVRKRVAMAAKAHALAAQARTSAIILIALPPVSGTAVSLLRPGYFDKLFGDPRGVNLLTISIIMMIIGTLVIRQMIKRAVSE